MTEENVTYKEMMECQTVAYEKGGLYYINFSSVSSCLGYTFFLNTSSGYWEIETDTGWIKDGGYTLINPQECTKAELNNLAFNIIDNYIKEK